MKALLAGIKNNLIENRSVILMGAALTALLSFYFICWHFTIIAFGSFYSVLDVADSFLRRSGSYLAASVIIASGLCALMIAVTKPLAKKIIIGVFMLFFAGSEFVRMIDWGALYFGGAHVDSNFWTHAFYTDGMVFLFTKESLMLYVSVVLFFAAMIAILKKIYVTTTPGDNR
jgi:hypothetical protein